MPRGKPAQSPNMIAGQGRSLSRPCRLPCLPPTYPNNPHKCPKQQPSGKQPKKPSPHRFSDVESNIKRSVHVHKGFGSLSLPLHLLKYLLCETLRPSPTLFSMCNLPQDLQSNTFDYSPIYFAFTSSSLHSSKYPASHPRQSFIC